MTAGRPRAAWVTGLLATAVTAGLLTASPANAIVGETAAKDSYAFTAKLDIGGKRSCSAALVERQWLITSASCFAEPAARDAKIAAGAPALRTTATIGRTDLSQGTGSVVDVVELVPREDRDLVMAKLARPVTGVTPVALATTAPAPGEELRKTGYGRTKDEWVPNTLHTAAFTVGTVNATSLGLAGKSAGAAVCQGDGGGPAFREAGGRIELVGVNSRAWRGGCLGTDAKETRTGAVDTRTDDLADWARQTVESRRRTPLGDYRVDFNGDGKADYVVVDDNSAVTVWVNNGGDGRGGWNEWGRVAEGVGVTGDKVRFADVNGDRKADYIAVDDKGGLHAWINNGGDGRGGWNDWGMIAAGVGVTADKVRLADINGDGKADYIAVDDKGGLRVWLNNGGDGRGGWSEYGQIASGVGVSADKVRLADVNGDRKADYIAVDDKGGLHAWINNGGDGRGGWNDWGMIAAGVGVTADKVRLADINGDGKADYTVVDDNGAVRVWLNNGGDGRGGWTGLGRIAEGAGYGYTVRI
ncbi:FG-GAP-like repeat-containing protein [Streptomyces cinnamoneus]|uniref:Fusidic acid esterase FusH n=1 Tax=Streptomyces cinnamoneus TaxID=53446 RepID=A0A918WP37_STRCJ|nr:FG-GAP-like repeat-containing protein [Streptomyces cinnamoneus]GHC64318.1 fusidic acid esterase FusH [Streptomyces cinnamoneus]